MTSPRRAALLLAGLMLAACGADGVPETPPPPADRASPPPVRTDVGINLSTSGYARVGVGVSRGPVSLGVGF